ncbi:MAG: hypothetical protein H6722_01150 [Sandaracinus sp.]|nr:hypothetical protein [Sandaracinus sp.]MCB9611048.1 hypothetical protein [Sandaracinus sp.]
MKTWPFAALALTYVSLLAPGGSLAQDTQGETVVIVEDADGATRVTALPYEVPVPTATPAPAEQAPVVLILPPGTQVRLLAEELAPPVAPLPAVPPPPVVPAPVVPAPVAALPPALAPSVEVQSLRLQARYDELRRERPGIGWPLAFLIVGAIGTIGSAAGVAEGVALCDLGEGCGRARRMGLALSISVGVLAVGVIRFFVNSRRRRALGREMHEIRRQLAYLQNGLPLR